MTSAEVRVLINRANESHEAAKMLLDKGFSNFSAAQSYYTMFYLAEALLYAKGLEFSSHSAVIAAYGKEFAKTEALDPKFHRRMIIVERRRAIGHYGAENSVSEEDAFESFQWAEEFMQAVKDYLEV
jgi:uncharacterized protein (UPF0332 family)